MTKPTTPCKKLGYKLGDQFRYIGEDLEFKEVIFTLEYDDSSCIPRFTYMHPVQGNIKEWLALVDVEPYNFSRKRLEKQLRVVTSELQELKKKLIELVGAIP